jgi:hypothetical protein
MQQAHIKMDDLESYYENESISMVYMGARRTDCLRMKSEGMHLTPTPAYFLVKIKQLHQALCQSNADGNASLLDCLDVHTSHIAWPKAGSEVLLERPDSVIIQVSEPEYITDEGIEAIDVDIHYGDPNGSGKTVCPPLLSRIEDL